MMFQANRDVDMQDEAMSPDPGATKRKVQHSIIGTDLKISGDLFSEGDITVHGIVEGSIKCRALTLGEAPTISSIEADSVRISGSFSGDVKARKVVLTETARVTGDILHESLEVKPGASIEGRLGRINKEKADGKAKAKAKDDAKETPAEATVTTLKAAQSGG